MIRAPRPWPPIIRNTPQHPNRDDSVSPLARDSDVDPSNRGPDFDVSRSGRCGLRSNLAPAVPTQSP